jgi:hypothetical protein
MRAALSFSLQLKHLQRRRHRTRSFRLRIAATTGSWIKRNKQDPVQNWMTVGHRHFDDASWG